MYGNLHLITRLNYTLTYYLRSPPELPGGADILLFFSQLRSYVLCVLLTAVRSWTLNVDLLYLTVCLQIESFKCVRQIISWCETVGGSVSCEGDVRIILTWCPAWPSLPVLYVCSLLVRLRWSGQATCSGAEQSRAGLAGVSHAALRSPPALRVSVCLPPFSPPYQAGRQAQVGGEDDQPGAIHTEPEKVQLGPIHWRKHINHSEALKATSRWWGWPPVWTV